MSENHPLDLCNASTVCARAFFNDDLDRYFFPDETDRLRRQRMMYSYFLRRNIKNVHTTSGELEGLMIMEGPYSHNDKWTLSDLFLGAPLVFRLEFRTIRKMMDFQTNAIRIRERLVKDPYWYLALIAVAPEFQGKGFASKLLKPILFQAEAKKEHVFLETHNPNNIPIYEKLGFRIIDSIPMGNAEFWHYCMIR